MSKTTKILIALVVVFGAIYAIQRFTSKNSTTETSRPFAGIDTAKVSRVTVDFGKRIVVARTDSGWMITEPVRFPAAPGQMSLLLIRMASNPTATVVADNLTDSSAYGLGKGAAYASFVAVGGKKIAMRVGDVTPDYDGCYIQLVGSDKVLQLSTNIRPLVGQSLTSWRDKAIFHFGISDVEAADFALGDTLYHFLHRDTTWTVNDIEIPQTRARDIVETLLGSRAVGFIDSTVAPSKVIIDYGVTLNNRQHIAGQVYKSAGSEITTGQLCLSNSADNQIFTISSTLPQNLLRSLRDLRRTYLTKKSS